MEVLAGESNFESYDLESVLSLFKEKLPKNEEYGEAGAWVGVGEEYRKSLMGLLRIGRCLGGAPRETENDWESLFLWNGDGEGGVVLFCSGGELTVIKQIHLYMSVNP